MSAIISELRQLGHKARRALAPMFRPAAKTAVLQAGRGHVPAESDIKDLPASWMNGRFSKLVGIVQSRDAADKNIKGLAARAPELKRLIDEEAAARREHEKIVDRANRMVAESTEATAQAFLRRQRLEMQLSQIRSRAINTLNSTADPSFDDRARELQNQINELESEMTSKRPNERQRANAEQAVLELPNQIEEFRKLGTDDAATDIATFTHKLLAARQLLTEMSRNDAVMARAEKEIRALHREQEAILSEKLNPDNFDMGDVPADD